MLDVELRRRSFHDGALPTAPPVAANEPRGGRELRNDSVRELVRERRRGRAEEVAAVGEEGADSVINCAAVGELVADSGGDWGVLIANVLFVVIGERLYFC